MRVGWPGRTLLQPPMAGPSLASSEIAEEVVHEVAALVAQGLVSVTPAPCFGNAQSHGSCPQAGFITPTPATLCQQEDVRIPRNICVEKEAASTVPPGRASVDVFGVPASSLPIDPVSCPNCARRVAASRFAPHLDKCMGRGRMGAGR